MRVGYAVLFKNRGLPPSITYIQTIESSTKNDAL